MGWSGVPSIFQSNIQENKDWNWGVRWRQIGERGLSEQHPREQGLKHQSSQLSPGARSTFQSNIQENKDWNSASVPSAITTSPFRATSKRTRIETPRIDPLDQLIEAFQSNIQENKDWNRFFGSYTSEIDELSEQHPREQGLKHQFCNCGNIRIVPNFQSNIQENKDWNKLSELLDYAKENLSEQHPREQGLKLENPDCLPMKVKLSEQHPREQGLKHMRSKKKIGIISPFRATSKRTRIETIQHPWSSQDCLALSEQHPREQGLKHLRERGCYRLTHPFRATSKRTRIETGRCWYSFQRLAAKPFRATSKRTRIETSRRRPVFGGATGFQSNIQENKDWNIFLTIVV